MRLFPPLPQSVQFPPGVVLFGASLWGVYLDLLTLAEVKAGGPTRRLVGLAWNSDDIIDLYAAFFREGPIPAPIEMPRECSKLAMDPDKVLKNGKVVGCSTSRVYSPYLRKMISLCTIDNNLTEPGTHVVVVWGDKGGPQKEIRATVIKLPFKEDKRRST